MLGKLELEVLKTVKLKNGNNVLVANGYAIASNGLTTIRIPTDIADGIYDLDCLLQGIIKTTNKNWTWDENYYPECSGECTEFQTPHISYCDFVSTDPMRLALNGVLVANNQAMCATDGAVAQWNHGRDADTIDIIVPVIFVKLANKIKAPSFWRVGNYCYTKFKNIEIWSKEIPGPYPRFENVVVINKNEGHELLSNHINGMVAEFKKYSPLQDKEKHKISNEFWYYADGGKDELEFKLPKRLDGGVAYGLNAKKLYSITLKNTVQATMFLGEHKTAKICFVVELKDGRLFNRLQMPLIMG